MKNNLVKVIFKSIIKEKYVVIKSFNPNDFEKGSDIDIFCYSIGQLKDNIINSINKITVENNLNIIVKNFQNHCHLDINDQSGLLIRFDLFDKIPNYQRINIRDSLFDIILETKQSKIYDEIEYYSANINFNNLIRYIEYIEYFYNENNKIKHLNFLEDNLKNDIDFYRNIHYYITFPFEKTQPKRKLSMKDLKGLLDKVKQTSLINLPRKVLKFLFN